MAQYKQSMTRMMGLADWQGEKEQQQAKSSISIAGGMSAAAPGGLINMDQLMGQSADMEFTDIEGMQVHALVEMPQFAEFLRRYSEYILRVVVPVLWVVLLVLFMDRDSFLRTMLMPLIGILAALLANCIPIGGGIVYVPLLSLLGEDINLSVAFTVATMTIGNGVFGFLHWLATDPSLIIWESFLYTVLPCSLGSASGILFMPPLDALWVKKFFGAFCLLVAVYVALLARAYGEGDDKASAMPAVARTRPAPSRAQWAVVASVFFLSGLLLVTSIGIGPALIAFFMLGDNYLGYSQKQAIVTGIITGGWVSAVPFLLHLLVLGDVPIRLWIMVLPGVYMGAMLAPRVYDIVGMQKIFAAFSVFLFMSAAMFLR